MQYKYNTRYSHSDSVNSNTRAWEACQRMKSVITQGVS